MSGRQVGLSGDRTASSFRANALPRQSHPGLAAVRVLTDLHSMRSGRLLLALMLATLPGALAAQQEELVPIEAPLAPAPDMIALARAAAARGDSAEALSRYLRVLAADPDNVGALSGAGRAALDVGDVDAAMGFYARAEDRSPRDGAVKAGLAAALVQTGDARGALRFFREAIELGVPAAEIAADRGLAYDLRGDPRRAQADYQLALRTHPAAETMRRLALSQAIGGDRAAALATLDPLLRKQDVPAWRARAFALAMTGDAAGAGAGIALVMAQPQAEAMRPYLARLAGLKPADKAAAVHLGRFPRDRKAAQMATIAPPPPRLAFDTRALSGPAPAAARQENWSVALPAATEPEPSRSSRAQSRDISPVSGQRVSTSSRRNEVHPERLPRQAGLDTNGGGVASDSVMAAVAAQAKADAKADAAAKKAFRLKTEALAKAKQAREEAAAEKAAARANPARHWVQVAGGANAAALPRAWAALKNKWPKQLAGRSPWTTHYRFTNRLLIGPFATSDAAQDWVSERGKEGFATFRVETKAGDPVERVGE